MKVLYLTVPSFFDLDVSLVREMSSIADVRVMLVVSPESKKSSAFSIEKLDPKCGLIPANEYPGLEKYDGIIDSRKWVVANNPDNSFLSCMKLSKDIKKYISRDCFDIIHTTTSCKTVLFLALYLRSCNHSLLTVHDPISHERMSWFENFIRRRLFYWGNKNILLLSKSLLTPFKKKYGIKEDKIFFSSLSVYDILSHFEETENAYGNYILFFGRIEPYKGVDLLIDAYEKSVLPSKGIKLVVAGKGKIRHSSSNLTNDVIFINRFIENDELSNLIRHCKYVVLPYLSATQSGCVMSAYAFNKPVLATNVGDLPLTVENGKTGMICEANDADDLCSAMNEMENVNLEILSHNIKVRYEENGPLSWNSIAKSLVKVYETIASK